MKYQAGDKVRCVKDTMAVGVKVGDVYTVKGFSHNSEFGTHITLEEVRSSPTECVFELVQQKHKPKPKVGDVVECVDTGGWPLTVGKQYVVHSVTAEYIRVINDKGNSGGYYPTNFKLIPDAKPVLTPEEVFEHLRKGTQLQYRRTVASKWVEHITGSRVATNPSFKMITEGQWRIKPEPEVIEVNGKKYIEIME